MPTFLQEERDIDRMIGKARRFKALVLDLRDNGGGYVQTLEHLVSRLIDHKVLVSVERRRRKVDTTWARPRAPFTGALVVLVNSRSASAAEMLARIVQLERRGTVIGDQTAGAVMTSRGFDEVTSGGRNVAYGVNVTIGEVRMADGMSLEGTGVRPDEVVRPTAHDLVRRRDPTLARAVALLGGGDSLSAEEGGALFPIEWP